MYFLRHSSPYHDIIESLTVALEVKDRYTAGHSSRVGDMADKACGLTGIRGKERTFIHLAGHLHDIGKIGIPDKILHKDGKLLPHEWEYIKAHPQIGFRILSQSYQLKKIASIVQAHHERWDGKGYPLGLQYDAIPVGARIIALCDSIDAMKSERPYRMPLDDKDCRQEIEKNSGKMYDPVYANCILKNWDKIVSPIYKEQNINSVVQISSI